jgi:CysZ protein
MGSAVFINRGVKFVMSFINPYFENVTMTGRWWENILEVLMDCSAFAIPFVLWLISIFIFLRLNKYIVLALMSPMMAILSERTNHILTNTSTPFSLNQLIQDSIRGAIISLRNLILELGLTLMIWGFILILMLFLPYLIFILAPLASVLVFFIGSYYYGFAVLDYVNERNQLNVKDSIRDIRSQRSLSIGLGSIFSILFMIPFVGVAVSTVTCTIAASIAKHQQRA